VAPCVHVTHPTYVGIHILTLGGDYCPQNSKIIPYAGHFWKLCNVAFFLEFAREQYVSSPRDTCFAWAGGTFIPVVLLCCVSFWFWREKGFDLHTHVLLSVQYSCGGVLVIWFWQEIVFGVTHILSVQYSCAVVSAFWLKREISL
jgi:hypothetical protein